MDKSRYAVQPAHRRTCLLSVRTLAMLVLSQAVATAALPAATGHAADTHAPPLTTQLDAYLSGLTVQHQFSGVVLAAQHGSILLSKGYGMADAAHKIPNTPATLYPVGGVGTTVPTWVAALQLEEQGKLHDGDPICSYLTACPSTWRPITVRQLLDGTSGLQAYDWGGTAGETISSRLRECQAAPLAAAPGTLLNYISCAVIVVGTILERVTGQPWAALMRHTILGPAGMRHSDRLTDAVMPHGLARDYSGSVAHSGEYYDDFFQLYATVGDVYAFNSALFGGKLLSPAMLQRALAPRAAVHPPDPGIDGARWAYRWKVGAAFGHPLIYLTSAAHGFTIANLHFPKDDVTLVVISNDDQNGVEGVAVHVAALIFGKASAGQRVQTARAVDPSRAIVATLTVPNAFGIPSGDAEVLWAGGGNGVVTRIDPSANKIVATITVNDPATTPGLTDAGIVQVTSGSGQMWATDRVHKEVVRIDPATNRVVARVPVGIEPFSLAIAGDTLWVDDSYEDEPGVNTIVRIDLRTAKVLATITNATTNLGQPFLVLAATPDALWYADWAGGTIKRLDAATNKVVATIAAGLQPTSLVVGEGAIWTANHYSDLVTRIDPRTNRVVARIPLSGYLSGPIGGDCCGGSIAVGAGAAWAIAGSGQRTLVRIDPQTNQVTAALTFPQAIGPITVAHDSVWVTSGDGSTYYRINPQAMQ